MDSHDPRTCPNLPEWAGFGHKAPFLLTVNGRFLFGATEKKMGVHSPRRKAAQSPVPAPWADTPFPYAMMTPMVKNATVRMRKYAISFQTYFSQRS